MSRKMEYTGRYSLSRFEFGYAKWYSLKYNEWLDEYNSLKDSVKGISYDQEGHGSGSVSDSTGSLASRRAGLRNKMLKVEHAAWEAGEDIAKYILIAVTNEDVTFEVLERKYHIPCGRTLFYERRRKYYYLLSKEI